MDEASRALVQGVPPGVPSSYRALADHRQVPRSTLHARAHGRRSIEEKAKSQQYLTEHEENALAKFILQLADLGQPVRMKFTPSLAFCLARQRTNPPTKPPGKNWTTAFYKRHPEIKPIKVKALDWNRHDKNIYDKVVVWFDAIGTLLRDPAVLAENMYNMDETGVMLSMLGSVKVLVGRNDIRNYRGARVKREVVTAIECVSADGRYLNPMIIWPARTHRSNWSTFPTPGWQYAVHESGYTNSYISLEWLKRIFDPETKERATNHVSGELKPRLLFCDGFGTHETLEIIEFCLSNNIKLCRLPSHTSHKLQPCDISTFSPLKAAYREQVERLDRGGVNKIGKEHFTSLYSPARSAAFTPKNIRSGFAAAGLVPFNPDRVLRTMTKPPPELTTTEPAAPSQPAEHPQNEVQSDEVQSPKTPVTAEGLVSLQNMIIQQRSTHTINETSTQRFLRLIQKLAKAAQMSFAKGILQQNHIKFLLTINNEAKVRRSTRSVVLGDGVIMGYEELVQARAKRAEKDAAKATQGKGKRGRKRKSAPDDASGAGVPEADAPEPKAKRKRVKKAPDSQVPDSERPGSVPVARMY